MKFKVEKRKTLYGWIVLNEAGQVVDMNGNVVPNPTKDSPVCWVWKLYKTAAEIARVLNLKEQSNEI